jgi:hypothetical protein
MYFDHGNFERLCVAKTHVVYRGGSSIFRAGLMMAAKPVINMRDKKINRLDRIHEGFFAQGLQHSDSFICFFFP